MPANEEHPRGEAAGYRHAVKRHVVHEIAPPAAAIYVFPNGNGRHAPLAANLLAERLGRPQFSWGRRDLVSRGDARPYGAVLRAPDAGDLAPLLAFARADGAGS
jgi:fido (protein-threonine AMPylation protein)